MISREIVVATKNVGKMREFAALGQNFPVNWINLTDFPDIEDVEETGATFAENAELKASIYAKKTGKFVIADDSGLEVTALNNAPGVFSARYAGENATNEEKIAKLLGELEKTNEVNRTARFVCVIAFADSEGNIIHLAEGKCEGKIAQTPCGIYGFGYDPIFIPNGFEQTFGELSDAIKHQISHRAQAFKSISLFLQDFFAKYPS